MISTSIDKLPVFFHHIEIALSYFPQKNRENFELLPNHCYEFFHFSFFLIDFPGAFKSISLTRKIVGYIKP